MDLNEPEIDEIVFNWIRKGFNSYGEILKLKSDHRFNTHHIIDSLERLEELKLIKNKGGKFFINNLFKVLD